MRTALHLTPAALSLLLLAAHFLRGGQISLVTVSLLLLALLFVRRAPAARILQVALLLGAAEWLRTLWTVAAFRMRAGQPWARFALILGAVMALNLTSALLLGSARLRRWYGRLPS